MEIWRMRLDLQQRELDRLEDVPVMLDPTLQERVPVYCNVITPEPPLCWRNCKRGAADCPGVKECTVWVD